MGSSDSSRGETHGVRRATLALVLVLLLVAGGLVVVRADVLDRWWGDDDAPAAGEPPVDDPAAVAPPPGVEAPPVPVPDPVARTSPVTRRLDPDAVRDALAPYLGDPDLGRHVVAVVAPLAGGRPTFTQGAGTAIPASTTKLLTTTAALLALGPDHVFTTTVRADGSGRVVLVGGGDPFLERGPRDLDGEAWPYPQRADLEQLAARTAAALRADGRRRVSLTFDDSLFSGPTVNPAWELDYVISGEVSPTSALWVDEGRARVGDEREADPAAEAARSFAEALAAEGIRVTGTPTRTAGAGQRRPGAELASASSAPLGQIVQRILDVSDNDATEVLLRHVGLAETGEGSIDAGRDAVLRLLTTAGVSFGDSVFFDGSGLARSDRADPATLVGVLQLAASAAHPDLRPVVTGLPVAGFTGSLTDRMGAGPPAGLGRVRAKTGTLSQVTSLAGVATGIDGQVMAFALMADQFAEIDTLDARQALDSAAAALGACACGAGGAGGGPR